MLYVWSSKPSIDFWLRLQYVTHPTRLAYLHSCSLKLWPKGNFTMKFTSFQRNLSMQTASLLPESQNRKDPWKRTHKDHITTHGRRIIPIR